MTRRRARGLVEEIAEWDQALGLLGYPTPVPEFRFARPRRWAFDRAWPTLGLAVEFEGGTFIGGRHTSGVGFERDCEKYDEAALRGWLVLRFTRAMLADGRGLAMTERALQLREKIHGDIGEHAAAASSRTRGLPSASVQRARPVARRGGQLLRDLPVRDQRARPGQR